MDTLFEQFLSEATALAERPGTPAPRKRSARAARSARPAAAVAPLAAATAPSRAPASAASRTRRAARITTPNQVVMPAINWDWPLVTSGSIALEQFQFADTLPQTIKSSTEYAPSSDSFSTNYRSFLDFIDAGKFPAASMLEVAKNAIKIPADPAPSSPAPRGWTKVTRAGIQRWAPIWQLSQTANDWKGKVLDGSIANPGTITLDLKKNSRENQVLLQTGQSAAAMQAVPGVQSDFTTVKMNAKAWGQISVYPGTWFNSSLLALGKAYVPDADVFFGPNGLLRGRVASFIVAYEVTIDFLSPKPVDSQLANNLSTGKDLYALGLPVSVTHVETGVAGGQGTVELKSTSTDPSIVAVIIDR